MRITNTMLINNMLYHVGKNMERLAKYQYQMTTGKKIEVPSDDPIVAAKALKYRTDLAQNMQFRKNTQDAISWLDSSESALAQITEYLQSMRELDISADNSTKNQDDWDAIRYVVEQTMGAVVNQANSSYAGRYLFSGYATDQKLLNDDGTYNISVGSKTTCVLAGVVKNLNQNPVTIGAGDQLRISLDGTTYYNIDLTSVVGVYDNTQPTSSPPPVGGMRLEDLAARLDDAINQAISPVYGDNRVNVVVIDGRITFEMKDTMASNGQKLNIIMEATAADASQTTSILERMGIKTQGTPPKVTAYYEDIKYQVGVGDYLTVNSTGTDIFGTGVKGETPELIQAFQRIIDTLKTAYHISSDVVNPTISDPLDFLSGNAADNTFYMTSEGFPEDLSGGTMRLAIDLSGQYIDGTPTRTMTDLANNIQQQIYQQMQTKIQEFDAALAAASPDDTEKLRQLTDDRQKLLDMKITVRNNGGRLVITDEQEDQTKGAQPLTFRPDTGQSTNLALEKLGFKLIEKNGGYQVQEVYREGDAKTIYNGLDEGLGQIDKVLNRLLNMVSDIGSRYKRGENTLQKIIADDYLFSTRMSNNENIDEEVVVLNFTNQQNLFNASLQVSGKIITPTLLDFLG